MGTSITVGTFVVTGVRLSRVYETSSFVDIGNSKRFCVMLPRCLFAVRSCSLLLSLQPYEPCKNTLSFAKKLAKSYHQRDFCPILVQPRQRNTLPRDVALARENVPPKGLFMNMSKVLRHHNSQLAANQLLGFVSKDSLHRRIGKNYVAVLIDREDRDRGGLGHQTELSIGRIERPISCQSLEKHSYLSAQRRQKLFHLPRNRWRLLAKQFDDSEHSLAGVERETDPGSQAFLFGD
jgi:hypothetical protein